MVVRSNYDSSRGKTLLDNIEHSKINKLESANIHTKYRYKDLNISVKNILDPYREILIHRSVEAVIPNEFLYKPEYVSQHVYGTIELWYLVLLVNDCPSMLEFDRNNIRILPPEDLDLINSIIEENVPFLKKNHRNPPVIDDMIIKRF